MSNNRITEGVGQKIVDALRKQSEIDIQNVTMNALPPEQNYSQNNSVEFTDNFDDETDDFGEKIEFSNPVEQNYTMPYTPQQSYNKEMFAAELDDFEVPANVAVLKQLITQLPSGVSRQTGAQIIKQTMEALGISMKSVLQEAQQVQDNLNGTSKECQASIVEHKKQIGILERQSQKLQRQSSALNDIITLFVQTGI
ncbi:hypothetical protein J6P92_01815 [bacterium]|nr:hypothetical protein [bacterium]